ncbi:beta-L-arabinofuranosidase (glycosyl hydrolase family 127) [Curtobacterium flaccumfaciens]|uniref:Beta-L-arabinofuranosidase (Glycosyl hydrolase family 127) n=1 Tax=Curtobacterium flaccumfaciens TaxID=2035 RepID=A0A4R6DCQ0_9MICO|nr:beta-L-arabinofuranosidase domain-containing protein [Curtobacterium flaccumfaciens]TDN42281.1 beta-L-arabinofuranosidase (glycosyl hydrolase family 127) [Curtobacterium flaccumfaciens]
MTITDIPTTGTAADAPSPGGRPHRPLPLGSITPGGWLLDHLRLQADNITGQLEALWPDVGPDSGWRGGAGENWERGPYYLDGLVPLAHVLHDDRLLALATPWIEWILGSQREDGFFGPTGNDDWWPRMVACKVLTQHADATGDERVAPFLARYFRHQLEHLPGRPLTSWGRARGADAALSVWWLYEQTTEDWLLDLVDVLAAQTIRWDEYLAGDLITGAARVFSHRTHGPNVAMGLKTGAVDALRDRDLTGHAARTESAFGNLDRWHGQAHGWFSGDEWLGGPFATAGVETCQVVEMMFTQEVHAQVYGRAIDGDRLEHLAYNLLPASSDPEMRGHQYHQQANQVEVSVARREWSFSSDDAGIFGLEPHFGCCTANLHQGWPKFVANSWLRDDDGLRVVAYAPVALRTSVGPDPVAIEVDTAYPFDETVTIRVETERTTPFALRLRIPEWADDARLTVGGTPVALAGESRLPAEDGYVTLERDWSTAGDVVLVLPMRARVTRRERQAAAVRLGPLTMVYSPGERWVEHEGAPGIGEWEIHPRGSWNWALDQVGSAASWRVTRGTVPAAPWSLRDRRSAPVVLHAPGARATEWRMAGAQADVPPASPVLDHGPDDDLRLVPYGSARLRVTEFPVIGNWRDVDDVEEPGR